MRPAYSVILFTTISGAGYGLLAVLGSLLLLGRWPGAAASLLAALAVGLVLVTIGLVASTFHLARAGRAWRAFSQWRTSWLSREGVAAIAGYAVSIPLALLLLLLPLGPDHPLVRVLGGATAASAVVTVFCTAMIYASLRPVPQWRHPAVPAIYLLLALGTGGLLLDALLLLGGMNAPGARGLALATLAGAALGKELYWRGALGRREPPLTAESATGLGHLGRVRLLDPPHTETSYLLREFGYQVARRHAVRLRRIVRLAGFALPLALGACLLVLPLPGPARAFLAVGAAAAAFGGALVERWLFFAEARHSVLLYYGAAAV